MCAISTKVQNKHIAAPRGIGLNFDRENVLILSKGDLLVIALLLFLDLDRFFFDWSDWILDVTVVLCLY